jgi:phospholipid/cholesterol/gamma-HCH transport system ATP-binding protein
LDPVNTGRINNLIRGIKARLGLTSIVVTHEMSTAFSVSDRLMMVGRGQVLMVGTPEEFRHTEDTYVRNFVEGRAPESEDVASLLASS